MTTRKHRFTGFLKLFYQHFVLLRAPITCYAPPRNLWRKIKSRAPCDSSRQNIARKYCSGRARIQPGKYRFIVIQDRRTLVELLENRKSFYSFTHVTFNDRPKSTIENLRKYEKKVENKKRETEIKRLSVVVSIRGTDGHRTSLCLSSYPSNSAGQSHVCECLLYLGQGEERRAALHDETIKRVARRGAGGITRAARNEAMYDSPARCTEGCALTAVAGQQKKRWMLGDGAASGATRTPLATRSTKPPTTFHSPTAQPTHSNPLLHEQNSFNHVTFLWMFIFILFSFFPIFHFILLRLAFRGFVNVVNYTATNMK